MLVYENLGRHPRRPAAWDIISYDTDAPDRIFCYYGYRDSRCYMTLYPCDRDTAKNSKKMRVRVERIRIPKEEVKS